MKSIPKHNELFRPLILALNTLGGSAKVDLVIKEIANDLDISEEILEQKYEKSGAKKFDNVCRFAREYLKRAGFLKDNSPRGVWELSDKGKSIVPLIANENNQSVFAGVDGSMYEKQKTKKETIIEDEIIEDIDAEIEVKQNMTTLDIIKSMDPYQFERLCAIIFQKLGYEDVDYTQKSKDGGIDGIGYISFGLVRFKVVLQAKRYTDSNIQEQVVREFLGAITQHNADKGVIITTSDFTKNAYELAKYHGIELVSGQKLISILQKQQIGFTSRIEYDIDTDYFKSI